MPYASINEIRSAHDTVERDALTRINQIRGEWRLAPLPALRKGDRNSAETCPLANCLSELPHEVEVNTLHGLGIIDVFDAPAVKGPSRAEPLTPGARYTDEGELGEFIAAFDEGYLPHLTA